MPKYQPIAQVDFAAASHLGSVAFGPGWSHPEPGHRWAMGQSAVLLLQVPREERDFTVLAFLRPFLHAPAMESQRIEVMHRGKRVFSGRISGHEMIAFPVRSHAADNGTLTLRFLFPESRPPFVFGLPELRPLACDFFGLWVIGQPLLEDAADRPTSHGAASLPVSPLEPRELLLKFVSLGHSCDFGMVQRRFGAEPFGLLRFAAITTCNLVRGLLDDFAGLGELENITPYVPAGLNETWIRERKYWFAYHAFITPGTASEEQLKHREARLLPLLRGRLLEDLADFDKIFILRQPEPMAEYQILAVLTALRLHGNHTLLILDQGTGAAPGTVERLEPGVMLGHLDGKLGAPPSHETWLAICAAAYEMKRSSHGAASA